MHTSVTNLEFVQELKSNEVGWHKIVELLKKNRKKQIREMELRAVLKQFIKKILTKPVEEGVGIMANMLSLLDTCMSNMSLMSTQL